MHRSASRRRVTADNSGEIVTKQYPKDECDINNILSQYKKTGIINHINSRPAQYLDLPSSPDFQSALNLIREADEAFADLPAVIRDRYNNDPERFLFALGDPSQAEFLRSVGILKKIDVPATPPASGPGSVPVPGSGPVGPATAPPGQAPGTSPTAQPDGRP